MSAQALVVLSGGQDSTTCLAIAISKYGKENVRAVTFYYGQRHLREVLLAQMTAMQYLPLGHWHLLDLSFLSAITTTSALTGNQRGFTGGPSKTLLPDDVKPMRGQTQHVTSNDDAQDDVGRASVEVTPLSTDPLSMGSARQYDIGNQPSAFDPKLPNSFVPGRNLIFLSVASSLAANLGIQEVWTGVCQTDFSGYPDCHKSFVDAFEMALNEALGRAEDSTSGPPWQRTAIRVTAYNGVRIVTPLMHKTKSESIELLFNITWWEDGVDPFAMLKYTHTCYNGIWPYCGQCPACKLRAKGFEEVNIIDPLINQELNPGYTGSPRDPLREYTGLHMTHLLQQFSSTRFADVSPVVAFARSVLNEEYFNQYHMGP